MLGGKARAGIVRDGAAEAYVEGVFELPPGLAAGGDERIPADAEELVLARRVWPDGRTRAYVCGRAATVGDLRELGSRMLSFYGQHEHRKLMLTTAQLDALDAFCGEAQAARRAEMAAAHERVRGLEAQIAELDGLVGARERELDLIGFELREIEEVDPSVEEETELLGERDRLRHQETLRLGAAAAADALLPEEGDGAGALLTRAASELESAAGFDPELAPLAERLAALRYEAEDVAAELRSYLDRLDAEPGRLEVVEERLAAFARLGRKHGGGIAEVIAHAEACRARREALEDADVTFDELSGELEAAREARDRIGTELSRVRQRPRRGWRRRCSSGSASWRWPTRASRSRCASARRLRPARSRRGRVPDRAQPGAAVRAAARGRVGRRALAGDARAAERRSRCGGGRCGRQEEREAQPLDRQGERRDRR